MSAAEQISFDDMPLKQGIMYCEVSAMGQPIIKIGMTKNRATLKQRITSHARNGFTHVIDVPTAHVEDRERVLKGLLAEHVITGTEWVRCDAYVATTVLEHFESLVAAQPNPWTYTDGLRRLKQRLLEAAVLNAQGMYGTWH